MKPNHLLPAIILIIVMIGACKKDNETPVSEPVLFIRSPVDTIYIKSATPLGNINPPGHTFPTDHMYFYLQGADFVPIYSIAGGTIEHFRYNEGSDDYSVEIKYSPSCSYYFDHVANPLAYVEEGYGLEAGILLGYCKTNRGAFDLGVIDYDVVNGFIIPERYLEKTLHCADPYLYFTDSVRNILYIKNARIKEPRGGTINYDIDGSLSGNWFLEGTAIDILNATYLYQDYQLTFAFNMWDPDEILIAAGGTLAMAPFSSGVEDNTPDPKEVSVITGLVKYELTSYVNNGTLLVQMVENRKIMVEVFPDMHKDDVDNFTSEVKYYIR
jgi:hypothetical protein